MSDAAPPATAGTGAGQTGGSVIGANFVCMLSMIIWASVLPAGDYVIRLLPALPLTAARIGIAAICLLVFWCAIEGVGVLRQANWPKALLIGGATIGFGAICLVVSQGMTDAVTVAVISASMPVVGMALEVATDGRKVTPALLVGMALSLCGAVIALWGTPSTSVNLGWGAAILLVSVITFTIGSRLTVTAFPELTPLGRTTVTITGAALIVTLVSLCASAAGAEPAAWGQLGLKGWAALAAFGIGGLAITQVLWIMSVGRLGIGIATLHMNASPFYVMLLLFAMGGEWIWSRAVGATIVGLGVLIAQGLIPLGVRKDADI